jgi:hypothetical protein
MRILLAVLASLVATPPPADRGLKIVTVTRLPRLPPVETTEYVAHDRRRREFRNTFGERSSPTAPETYTHGPRMAMVERCDAGQRFELNLDAREYTTGPGMNPGMFASPRRFASREVPVASPASGPTVSIEITTTDTGERKQVFGRTARHVITVRKQTSSGPGAGESAEATLDGWYIDLDQATGCDAWGTSRIGLGYEYLQVAGLPAPPRPQIVFKEIGTPEKGFPIEIRLSTIGSSMGSLERKVTELTSMPLDAALFEVPRGFYHANRWDRVLMSHAAATWRRVESQMRHFFGLGI